jgi:hypothetical protein
MRITRAARSVVGAPARIFTMIECRTMIECPNRAPAQNAAATA